MKNIKVLFIDYSQNNDQKHPQHFFAPTEIGYCASILEKAECSVSFLDIRINKAKTETVIRILKQKKTDILLLKPIPRTKDFILRIADSLKDTIKHIYCYGPAATLWPQMFLYHNSPVSGILRQEIEYTILDLVKSIREGADIDGLKGVSYFDIKTNTIISSNRELIADLDSLPFPKHSMFINKGYSLEYPVRLYKKIKTAYILSSRGCPEKCKFCSIFRRSSYGEIYRSRSAENVVSELENIISLGFNTVYFLDDNFSYDKTRTKDICNTIIKKGIQDRIRWVAQCNPKSLDEEIIQLMKKAGCSTLCLGIESVNEKTLKVLGKDIRQADIIDIVDKLKQAKIMIVAFFIIGSPRETKEDILRSIRFCKRVSLDMLQVHYCSVYPDSKFGNKNISAKLTSPYIYDAISGLSEIGEAELRRLYSLFYRNYYLSLKTILGFIKNNLVVYIVNWKEKVPFCIKSIGYILGVIKDK